MFAVGTTVHLETTVYNEADVATDPADLSLTVRDPAGTETSVAFAGLTNETGAGVWSYDYTPSLPGVYTYRWSATTPTVRDEGTFEVRGSAIAGSRSTGSGPCTPWCDPADLVVGWTAPTYATTQILEQACAAASELLYERAGRRWPGLCWDSIVPSPCSGGGQWAVIPTAAGDTMTVVARGGTHPAGCCWGSPVIDLGSAQVSAVDAVRVDGTAIATSAYRLIDRRWLARIDGIPWPCCSDPTDTTPSLEVDFTFGEAPPALGWFAAVAVAREIVRGLDGGDCAVDPRVVALVREGVSLDLAGVNADGMLLDVPAVARFLGAVNPFGLQRAASVIVPGRGYPSRI